jgi:dTMP kinase
MQQNPYQGKFIVFEGPDGSGQNTQSRFLGKYFQDKGYQVVLTEENTLESKAGQKIEEILEGKRKATLEELQLLFIQDRREHLKNLIIPCLEEGKIVISARYFLSTCAYAGISLAMEKFIDLQKDIILPDLTFVLDVPAEECLKRIKARGKKLQLFEKKDKLEKIRENYQQLAKRFENTYLINGELAKERVFEQIKKIVIEKLNL